VGREVGLRVGIVVGAVGRREGERVGAVGARDGRQEGKVDGTREGDCGRESGAGSARVDTTKASCLLFFQRGYAPISYGLLQMSKPLSLAKECGMTHGAGCEAREGGGALRRHGRGGEAVPGLGVGVAEAAVRRHLARRARRPCAATRRHKRIIVLVVWMPQAGSSSSRSACDGTPRGISDTRRDVRASD
jgi:hypothetical protein